MSRHAWVVLAATVRFCGSYWPFSTSGMSSGQPQAAEHHGDWWCDPATLELCSPNGCTNRDSSRCRLDASVTQAIMLSNRALHSAEGRAGVESLCSFEPVQLILITDAASLGTPYNLINCRLLVYRMNDVLTGTAHGALPHRAPSHRALLIPCTMCGTGAHHARAPRLRAAHRVQPRGESRRVGDRAVPVGPQLDAPLVLQSSALLPGRAAGVPRSPHLRLASTCPP